MSRPPFSPACARVCLRRLRPALRWQARGLKNPQRKKKPAEAAEAVVEIKYVEDCNANFADDPKKAHPQPPMSRQLFDAGEVSLDQSDKAKEDR